MGSKGPAELGQEGSERRLQEFVRLAPDGIIIVSRSGEILLTNDRADRMFGYEHGELEGQPHDVLLPPVLRERHGQHRRDYLANPRTKGKGEGRELQGRRKDGSEFSVEISLGPLEVAGQEPQVISIVRDITARKQIEAALKRSEEGLAEAQRLAHLGSWDWDIVNNDLRWSDEMCRIWGLTQQEFGGNYEAFFNGLHPDDRQLTQQAVDAALHEGRPYGTEYRVVQPGGAQRVVYAQGRVERDESGGPLRMYGTALDITQRKQAELELQRHRDHLQELADEQTVELREAMERAQEADRLKSAFLATMSHELRTPLNSVIGFTGVLLQQLPGPLNEEQGKQLTMVRDNAQHLLNLINDVLDISKIEAGQLEVASKSFSLRRSIQKTMLTIKPLAEQKGLSLVTQVSQNVGEMVSDERRVEQILINLLNNAVKFTEAGEVRLAADVREDQIQIEVRDTGIGIRQEDMPNLFEAFRQLDAGVARRYEGTGLGLSICRKLARLLGGEVSVSSEGPGRGSTFMLRLPLRS